MLTQILMRYARECSREPEDLSEIVKLDGISESNYLSISEQASERDVFFVDGGRNKIYSTLKYGLYVARVSASNYRGKKKIQGYRATFLVFIENNEDYSIARLEKIEESEKFSLEDIVPKAIEVSGSSTLYPDYVEEPTSEFIARSVQEILEWSTVKYIADKFPETIIVKDGSLQMSTIDNDSTRYAIDAIDRNRIKLIGISKRSNVRTSRNYPLVSILMLYAKKIGLESPWIYYPIRKNITEILSFGDVAFCTFHKNSEHVFRTDFYNMDFEEFVEIARILSYHSSDPAFYGYPYGLIEADENAKVPDEEVREYRRFFTTLLRDYGRYEWNSVNASEIIKELSIWKK